MQPTRPLGQVRIAIAGVGLDPNIGYLHVCRPGRQALVYDLMEPYRPQVDREVLAFIRSQTFTPRDFVIDAKGICRLHPELARQVSCLQTARVDVTTAVTAVHDASRVAEDVEYATASLHAGRSVHCDRD